MTINKTNTEINTNSFWRERTNGINKDVMKAKDSFAEKILHSLESIFF